MKDIIGTCTQFLVSSRNKHGLLPVHAAYFRDSCSVFVPLLANAAATATTAGQVIEEVGKALPQTLATLPTTK